MIRNIQEFCKRLSARRRRQFYLVVSISLISSIAEIFSLATLLPLLTLIASPAAPAGNPIIEILSGAFGLENSSFIALTALLLFITASLFAGATRFLLLLANNRYTFGLASELSTQIYRKCLYQPYPYHLQSNSSVVIDGVMNKAMAVTANVVAQILSLISAALIGGSILITLIITDPLVAAITGSTLTLIYAGIVWAVRDRLKRNGEIVARDWSRAARSLQEGLGGIRDVLIDGTQNTHAKIFAEADHSFKMALSRNAVIAGAPRFVVETFGMILIASLALFMTRDSGGVASIIPTLGVLALGAQRLLPMLQQGYAALTTIRGSDASLRDVIKLLDLPEPPSPTSAPVSFNREIRLVGVQYQYPNSPGPVLHGIDVAIQKGSRIGIFGPTGSGKSTTLDIIMGLLTPTGGQLIIDGMVVTEVNQTAWRRRVAHVPQTIFLSDATVAQNIAFGSPPEEIDMVRVRAAARAAQIDKTIEAWPAGYNALVGERGVRLSGGQRQRIGVARALYKQVDLIILDEATSALDNETERELIKSIEELGSEITIIMVAHRLSTLKNCDALVEIERGLIKRIGRYNDLVLS